MKRFPAIMNFFTRKNRRQNAQGLVEFALVMPLLALLIYGTLEAGRLIFIDSNVVTAAREAVRYGSATGVINGYEQYKNCAGIRQAAQKMDFLGSIEDANIVIHYLDGTGNILYTINTATCPAASAIPTVPNGGSIKVSVKADFVPILGLIPLISRTTAKNNPLSSVSQRTILGKQTVSGAAAPPGTTTTQPPVIDKFFLPASIILGEKSTLTFTLSNPNDSTPFTNLAFSDTYPSGLVNATPLVTTNNCGGSLDASAGGNSIALSGGSLGTYGSCTLSVVVTSGSIGNYSNTSGQVSSTEGGSGNTAAATLAVTSAFVCNNNTVVHGSLFFDGNVMETMTLNNNTGQTLTIANIVVTWNSDKGHQKGGDKTLKLVGIQVASQTVTISSGNSGPSYTFTHNPSWTLPSGRSTFAFTFDKSYDNVDGTELVLMNFSNPGCEAFTFNSDINSPPVISKVFSPDSITAGGTSTLTFTITNPNNAAIGLTGIGFTDAFPSGMTRSSTPANLQCQGTVTSTTSSITLSGGVIPAESSCTVTVIVTAAAGTYVNTSGVVGSTNGGTGNTASATLTASVLPPTLNWKRFNPNTIQVGGTSTLSIKITNPNSSIALTGLAITDTFPSGMTLASTPTTPQCGGTVTSTSGSITLSTGTLAGGANCIISASVTAASAGSYVNTSGAVTSTNGGTGGTGTATLTVGAIQPPSISKFFSPASIQTNAASTLSFSINNPNNATTLTSIAFSDTYPSGLVNVNPLSTTNSCGGSLTANGNGNSIILSGGSLNANNSCSVTIQVTASNPGTYANSSGPVSSTNGGTGNTGSATLTIVGTLPPSMTKSFSPAAIQVGGTSTLSFIITNSNSLTALTGLAFTDTFPSGMTLASTSATPQCGGAITSTSGSITLSNGTLAVGSQCTVSVNVTATTIKSYTNTSGAVTTTNAGTGNTASATLTVSAIQAPTFTGMSFAPNQILTGAASTLNFTIRNPNSATTLTGIAFSDTYPSGLTNVNPLVTSNTCGGTLTASGNGNTFALSSVSLASGVSCTVSIQVTTANAGTYTNSTGSVSSTNGGTGNTTSASLLVITAPCNASTVTHGPITYPGAYTMQMAITNATGETLTLNQMKVWWNYAYGNYKNSSHPRDPLALQQVQLGSVFLYGPIWTPTSPLTIPGNNNVLSTGTSNLTVTFGVTYDNHEYDAFTITFTNGECSGFTLSAP